MKTSYQNLCGQQRSSNWRAVVIALLFPKFTGCDAGEEQLAKGILVHRADSKYDDFPEEQYQFPKRYLNRAKQFEGDWIAYYEPRGGGGRMAYTAIARIAEIHPDPNVDDMFLARIEPGSFLPLEVPVDYRTSTGFIESDLSKPDGSLNQGLIQWAIRPISEADFGKIVELGFPDETDFLPRHDDFENLHGHAGFSESQPVFDHERTPVEKRISVIPRDRVFRKLVLEAYDSRCAITGLQLINGGGRAEVEAAHIKPVKEGGPDTIRNGIALSGTVHWMFDRGMISLTNNLEILVSRQANDPDQIWSLVNDTKRALAPANANQRPHPKFLEWHRQNCFKT